MRFPLNHEDIMAHYEYSMEQSLLPFFREPIRPHTLYAMTEAARHAQNMFLFTYKDYVALSDVTVTDQGFGTFNIDAPIGTRTEKLEIDERHEAGMRLWNEAHIRSICEDTAERKREASLRRKHRRLSRRHLDKIPYSTKHIWMSLTIGQQYAILKDIDYGVRHAK